VQTAFGPAASIMLVGQGMLGIFLLSSVNYVEHYGLQRGVLRNGKLERVTKEHSWNANYLMTNAVILRLQRHADHHMNANKPYYELNSIEGAPKLPAGYSAMMLLALVPPLWFCVMNPRVHLYRLLADIQRQGNPETVASSP
jgi:alkane 1-monooxygenase